MRKGRRRSCTYGNGSTSDEGDEETLRTLRRPEGRLVRKDTVEGTPHEELLKDDGNAEENRERPSDDASDGVATNSGGDALPSDLNGRETDGGTEEDEVEGEGGGEEGG